MRSLIESIKLPFGYEHYIRLRAIEAHDFTPVQKKVAQDRGGKIDPNFLERAIHYLKRYYAQLVLDPLNPATMARPLDDFWHVHALHSHQYIAFCNQVYGEYLHHVPLLFDDKLAVKFVSDMYIASRKKHIDIFTDIDNELIPIDPKGGACCTPTDLGNPTLRSVALFPALPFSKHALAAPA